MKSIKKTIKATKTTKTIKAEKVEATPKAEKVKMGWSTMEGFDKNLFRVGGLKTLPASITFEKAEGESEKSMVQGAILFQGCIHRAVIGKKDVISEDFKPVQGKDYFRMNKALVEKLGGKILLASDYKKPTHLIDTKDGQLHGFSLGEKNKWSAYALILKTGKIYFNQKEQGGSKFNNPERVAENSFVKGIIKQLA